MTPKEVVEFAKSKKIEMVDLKFMDFVGTWQHFAVPIYELQEDNFEEGFGFDGSSIRGWQPIHASDMLVIPDADTAIIDPFIMRPTLSLICNIVDPITKEAYSRDPRNIARKTEAQHHEVATAGQAEIDLRFDTLVKCADALQWYKYICKNVARKFGKTVTFMPKPLFADNGSGMHTHQSLWKGGKPLFAGEEYGGLSK